MAQPTRPLARAGHRTAANWSYLAPPPRAPYLFGWSILPLRLFLGITFCFAGLQKLANPNFFSANSPSGIHAQLIAAIRVSPLHSLLGHLLSFATPIGVLIALSELAIGLGAVLGLWTRVAAGGGALLSFTLFLTVSFHSSPYYTGADIVFLFAWLPLIVGGSGGVLSLDAVLAERAHREGGLAPSTVVPVPFSVIQQVCGHFERGTCTARAGLPCQIAPCPVLTQRRSSTAPWRPDRVDRRTVVLGGAAVGMTGVVGLAVAGAAAAIGRMVGGARPPEGGGTTNLAPQKASAPTTTGTKSTGGGTAPAGSPIGLAKDVPVRGSAQFTDPRSGQPGLVLQPARGQFVAFNAVCPHAGCTVNYFSGSELIVCPCHGSEFNPASGAVETGPAQRGLAKIAIAVGPDGQLYADG
jgi:thiosulfate dehydrogenase [quinone] large subunit